MSARSGGSHVSPQLLSRPRRAIPVTLLGIVLVAVGVIAAVLGGMRLAGNLPSWASFLAGAPRSAAWNSPWGWIGFAVVAALALICLFAAILPGGVGGVRLRPGAGASGAGGREIVMTDADLEGLVERSLLARDGISRATAQREGTRLTVTASTTVADPGKLRETIDRELAAKVDSLGLETPLTVKLRLR
jgi:hypothetical protein